MFKESIRNMLPEDIVSKIYSTNYTADQSLLATAAILLHTRVENLKIVNRKGIYDEPQALDKNAFNFFWIEKVENPEIYLELHKNIFTKTEKLPVHEKFISEQLNQPVMIRIMPNENAVCIFTNEVTNAIFHCVQFFIPKFFPVFKDKPITSEEKTFLETLTHKISYDYIKIVQRITNSDSFQRFVMKYQLESFEKKLFKKKAETAKNKLNDLDAEMNRAMQIYKEASEKRIETLALIYGFENMATSVEEHTALQDYLMNNNRLCNVRISESAISFIVKTFLAPYYTEDWDTISNRSGMFESIRTENWKAEDVKLLLDSIFSENRCLKLKMCAYFYMDYLGSEVESKKNYNFIEANESLKSYIPNAHLNIHNCFGQNKKAILEQLAAGDAIGAIECAAACAQRINFHERITFDPFVRSILKCEEKCLVTEDGTELTPAEAVKYLKGQNNE